MFCCKNKDDGASPVKKPKKAPVVEADGGFKLVPAQPVEVNPGNKI